MAILQFETYDMCAAHTIVTIPPKFLEADTPNLEVMLGLKTPSACAACAGCVSCDLQVKTPEALEALTNGEAFMRHQ